MTTDNRLLAERLKIQRYDGQQTHWILTGKETDSFTLKPGELIYLGGVSGVGKSTLLSTLARLHPLADGMLYLNQRSYLKTPLETWRSEIILLMQTPVMFPDSVANNLRYPLLNFKQQQRRLFAQNRQLPSDQELTQELQQIGLDIQLDRSVQTLSGGQKSRIALLRALLVRPQILLADEPVANLDPTSTQYIWQRLKQFCHQGGTVLVTSHQYEEQWHDKAIYIDKVQGLLTGAEG